MVKGTELILDLEKKLNLYSNHIEEQNFIENTQCKELVDIVFSVFEKKELQNEVKNFNEKYDEALLIEDNKIKYSYPNNFSKIGIEIFERLYFDDKEIALKKWLEIIELFESYGFWYWLVELSLIEEIREYFLDEITEYIIKNKEIKEDWIKRFEEYETNRPSYHRYFDITRIPKSFDNYFDIYKFFKENKYQDFLFDRFGIDTKASFVWCLIQHEVPRPYYYNNDSYSRINRLLVELKDDYFVVGEILSSEEVRFNTYLLSNSQYCHYGFLNIITMHIYVNNLVKSDEFDYRKQWLELISNQTVNIFISTLMHSNKNDIAQIVFYVLNYLAQSYFKSKQELVTLSLEKLLNKLGSLVLKDDTLLFNTIVEELVKRQIKLFEHNDSIQKDSYFILNWYLKNLIQREKVDDEDYCTLKAKITTGIYKNIKTALHKSIETKHFYINSSELLKDTDFHLFYELSSDEFKNNWTSLVDIKKLKDEMQTDDRHYASSLGKFYLEVLNLFYSKTYDERLEKTIVELVIKLGIEEELGIFFSTHENKLYDSFLNILNNFQDENYQLFINKIFKVKDIKNLLQIYHVTISNDRKEVLKTKILNFDFKSAKFHNYNDLQNSINFALNHNFNDIANTLVKKYKEALEQDKQELLKRKSAKKEDTKIDKTKDTNTVRIDLNDVLKSKILAFEQLKYKKDLVDIYHDESKTLEEKLEAINRLNLPSINTKSFKDNELKLELSGYKGFITALIHLDEKPLTAYDILRRLNQNKPNHQYLINMLRAYYEAYKDDVHKKEKFEHIISEYKKLEEKLENYEKELYDYQVLLALYADIDDFKSFSELWSELPEVYYYDLYIAQIRCKFLQKNKQFTEALNYLEELKLHHKSFNEDDTKKISELEEKIKNQITIEVKEKITSHVVLENSRILNKYEAKNYWLQIKDMDDQSHAHIFASQESFEEYIRDIMLHIAEELLERKVNLHRVSQNNKLELEDIINDWVTSLLSQRKSFLGWKVLDQKRGGVSGSKEGVGEKDLVVKNSKDRNLFLFEAFKNKIEDHLNKLDGYNATGCKLILVFVYTKEKDFTNYSTNYKDKISKMNYTGFDTINLPVNVEKVDSPSYTIHLYKEIRQKNKEDTIILHYLLDFN
ncbi:hypothetical protein [Sulfurimonas sp.]|uniref:hypothetical protein n=1 Tax=Sulfurimonas sp. TaxID=2022749 RepID=UPI0019E5A3E8|nr:hypothetical protein [Sulfurimonas sp.]MBE0514070.1 hypothetical protein [Sulfurimonas sp.]